MFDALYTFGLTALPYDLWSTVAWPVLWALLKIIVVLIPLLLSVAY